MWKVGAKTMSVTYNQR